MADTGFRGTVAEFIDCADCNLLVETISGNLARGSEPEWWSWRDGLQKLANDLRLASRDDNYSWIRELTIVCELCFTGSRHRADIVLGGMGSTNNPCLLVLEAKQWSSDSVGINEDDSRYVVANAYRDVTSRQLHPILQARGYASSLGQTEALALHNAQVLSGAYLPNMRRGNPAIEEHSIRRANQDFLVLLDGSTNLRDILSRLFSGGDESGVISQIIEDEEFVFSNPTDYDVSPDESTGDEWSEEDEGEEHESMNEIQSAELNFSGHGFYGPREHFIDLCDRNLIAHQIRNNLGINMRETTSEFRSWREGLYRLSRVLREVNVDLEVACEVPTQAGMVDVILGGRCRQSGAPAFLVIELKQWSHHAISRDEPEGWMVRNGVVRAVIGPGGEQPTLHPSWQARRYVHGLRNYKMYFETIPEAQIRGIAYLPNLQDPDETVLTDESYILNLGHEQLFSNENIELLADFISTYFQSSDSNFLRELLESPHGMTSYITEQIKEFVDRADDGDLVQSSLVPSGEQQRAIDAINISINSIEGKQIHIVQGGPGTGKTIVGLFLLFSNAQLGSTIRYIAGNSPSPRNLVTRIADEMEDYEDFSPLIKTAGLLGVEARKSDSEFIDLLIVDEAQSLLTYGQPAPIKLEDAIRKSRIVVFLMDERQSMHLKNEVTASKIREICDSEEFGNIRLEEWRLQIQQRAGQVSNLLVILEYLLGYTLQRPDVKLHGFNMHVFNSANEMRNRVIELNEGVEEAGMVGSYCWRFISRENQDLIDIVLDEGDFQYRWNKGGDKDYTWLLDKDRNERVGYPPEIQGQELHHAGLILGPDISITDDSLDFIPENHHFESEVFGGLRASKFWRLPTLEDKIRRAEERKSEIINDNRETVVNKLRNQYWVLMTRGMRSLQLYSEDPEVRDFLRQRISEFTEEE